MSGPWDRPSRDPGGEWPAEDIDTSSGAASDDADQGSWRSRGLWAEDDQGAEPSWEAWPAEPPPDDYLVEDPPAPALSDPWAEAWTDDATSATPDGAPASSWPGPPDAAPVAEPPAWEAPEPPEPESSAVESPAREEPGPEPPEPEPPAEMPEPSVAAADRWSEAVPRPRVEPWSSDVDPWGGVLTDDEAPAGFGTTESGDIRPATQEPEPPPPLPDWLPEPAVEPSPDEAGVAAEAAPEPPVVEEPAVGTDVASPGALDERQDGLDRIQSEDEEQPLVADGASTDRPWWRSIGPWRPSPADALAAPELDTPAALGPDEAAGEQQPTEAADEPAVTDELHPTDGTDGATDAIAADGDEDDHWAGLASWEDRPDEGATATIESPTTDATPPVSDATQVLPTSWAPPLPGPAAPPQEAGRPLEPVAGGVRTRLDRPEAGLGEDDEPQPSTAEQAIPWLIGFILLLAGMVIVLLALIFAGDESLGGPAPGPSGSILTAGGSLPPESVGPSIEPSARPTPGTTPEPTPPPTPTPVAVPEYGPLEMIFQGRSTALAPIYLLLADFTVPEQVASPEVLAQDEDLDVRRFAWAPDGTLGAGLYVDRLVSIEPGVEKRAIGEGISTITFGDTGETLYAARVTSDGDSDMAAIVAIDYASGASTEVASVSYPRPEIVAEEALREAQFADEGGAVRLYWMEDETLLLYVLGAGTWKIDPDNGGVTALDEAVPVLWAPDGERRIGFSIDGATTSIGLVDAEGERLATTSVDGAVSHLRWSPRGDRVVFTVGRTAPAGGIVQNLFLWDLGDGVAPVQLTDTGAAFGAEWRGSQPLWRR